MIPAPPGYEVNVQRQRDDGSVYWLTFPLVAFDDDGFPLVVDGPVLRHPSSDWHLSGPSPRFEAPVPAEPGWYGLFANHQDQGESNVDRLPVVAWHACLQGESEEGDATIIGESDPGRSVPLAAFGRLLHGAGHRADRLFPPRASSRARQHQ
jgi:hypothetical protein